MRGPYVERTVHNLSGNDDGILQNWRRHIHEYELTMQYFRHHWPIWTISYGIYINYMHEGYRIVQEYVRYVVEEDILICIKFQLV